MQLSGRCGWLLRVLEEGRVDPQGELTLVDRPYPELTVKRTADILFNQARNEEELQLLLENPALSPNWRQHAAHWLEHGVVADWSRRLLGPTESLHQRRTQRRHGLMPGLQAEMTRDQLLSIRFQQRFRPGLDMGIVTQ